MYGSLIYILDTSHTSHNVGLQAFIKSSNMPEDSFYDRVRQVGLWRRRQNI